MKRVICFLDEQQGIIYQDEGRAFMLGSKSHTHELTEADSKSSSQDIVKLKHGGVI